MEERNGKRRHGEEDYQAIWQTTTVAVAMLVESRAKQSKAVKQSLIINFIPH